MTHYVCPYSDDLLDQWESVSNPIGDACHDCTQYDCEHNMSADPEEAVFYNTNNPEDGNT